MALLSSILKPHCSSSIKGSSLTLSFLLFPNISSSFFSTLCRAHPTTPPPQPSPPPPVPKKVPFAVSAHGKTWQDPYRWMSNTDDPDLADHLNKENSYAEAFMADTQNLQRTLFSEMKSRMPAKISTPPERWGPWLYYQYIPEGKEYPVLCRRLGTEKGYVHVGTCRISPDHHFLAYTLDTKGDEQFMLQIKDLRSGCVIPKVQVDGVVSLAWAQDGKSNSSFCVDITSTKDGKFITVYLIDAANPLDGLQRVWKRVSGVQYFLEHHHGLFYVLTNAPLSENKVWSGEGYYLASCRGEDLPTSNWQNIILPSEDLSIQDMDMFDGHLVLSLSKKGFSMLCSINLPVLGDCKHQLEIDDLDPWFFALPSNLCNVVPGSNHDFHNSVYRAVLSSPVMPDVVVDYDMSSRRFSIVQQEEVRDFYDRTFPPTNQLDLNKKFGSQYQEDVQISESQRWKEYSDEYCCVRKEVISHDGVRVPLTILYSHTAWDKSQSPGLLKGYGAYGEVLDKSWCAEHLCLLDRGWVVAFADVRGGGGADSSWHKSGTGFNKLNSIYDFVSCGNYLIEEGYVHKDRLGAIGHSAGGLLVGATINMYPDLFRASILKVPFLDICNTLMDPSLPLTILDYEEFGNPQIQSKFELIFSYSPYDNISQGSCYPSMLVTASLHDPRVGFWEAAKWVAKVRESTCPRCSRSVILKTNMAGGHFGEGGRAMGSGLRGSRRNWLDSLVKSERFLPAILSRARSMGLSS
ncbi:prolyl endopeptidase-like [Pyrus ussuriensis x Pyrus communis]|uniref:Prolyl endopeptidase n=1 Tax=Pyrus ussuriensis x Pyrus communis TaxID=2448454 RepID=A0A5N5GU57_9ROSA|nr:prolyl endopeptidase-like [Pyrus ussuriensis x Pyrus communis]